MPDTSSTRHRRPWVYGVPGHDLPGNLGHGQTAQQQPVPEAKFIEPVERRAERKGKSRASRKSPP